MRPLLMPSIVMCLLSLGSAAVSQEFMSRGAGRAGVATPVLLSSTFGQSLVAADETGLQDSASGELPSPLSAAPPPDPDTPSWGQYLAPSTAPVPPLLQIGRAH